MPTSSHPHLHLQPYGTSLPSCLVYTSRSRHEARRLRVSQRAACEELRGHVVVQHNENYETRCYQDCHAPRLVAAPLQLANHLQASQRDRMCILPEKGKAMAKQAEALS
jgi:hypothetical protein